MPQPNKGTHGKPQTSQPMVGPAGSKTSESAMIKFGMHTKGTKGKGNK